MGMPNFGYYCQNKNFKSTTMRQKNPKKELLTIIDNKIVVNTVADDDKEIITCTTYSKKSKNRTTWSNQETDIFYMALQLCGSDFSLINRIFSDKSRRSLKMKFIKEERKDKQKIDTLLNQSRDFDTL